MSEPVLAYTTSWCPDCRRSKRVMTRLGVAFTEIDIEEEAGAEECMRAANGGSGKVPTIVIGDCVLVEPTDEALEEALSARPRADAAPGGAELEAEGECCPLFGPPGDR